MINTIIFDMDGTLLDTLVDLSNSVNFALKSHNINECTYEEIKSYVGNGTDMLVKRAMKNTHLELFDEVYNTFKIYYKDHAMDNLYAYDGIIDLLKELKNRNYKIGCVTNKLNDVANSIVDTFFNGLIDVTIGHSEGMNKKPHPDMCNKCLQLLNSNKDETIFVGDSDVDYETAINSNLECFSCTWGFKTKEFLKSINVTHLIDKPSELLQYLK